MRVRDQGFSGLCSVELDRIRQARTVVRGNRDRAATRVLDYTPTAPYPQHLQRGHQAQASDCI